MKKIGIFNAIALTLAGCNNYNPANNVAPDVYGPPEIFEEPAEEDDVETEEADDWENETDESKDSFSPEDNIEPDVYGPPEFFEPSKNEIEGVYGPPEMIENFGGEYRPENNVPEVIYGPPEMLEDGQAAPLEPEEEE